MFQFDTNNEVSCALLLRTTDCTFLFHLQLRRLVFWGFFAAYGSMSITATVFSSKPLIMICCLWKLMFHTIVRVLACMLDEIKNIDCSRIITNNRRWFFCRNVNKNNSQQQCKNSSYIKTTECIRRTKNKLCDRHTHSLKKNSMCIIENVTTGPLARRRTGMYYLLIFRFSFRNSTDLSVL